MQIWDLRQATKREGGATKPIKVYGAPSPVACVAFDFDQKQMAAACGSSVQLYDLTTGKVCTRWIIPQSHSVCACLALSRVASFGGCVAHQATAMRFKTPVLRVAYSPHKTKTLLSADGSGTVCVLDTKAFRVVKRFSHVHPGGATCVAFSRVPQPQRFFSCGADGTAVMYSECVARPCVIVVCWPRSCLTHRCLAATRRLWWTWGRRAHVSTLCPMAPAHWLVTKPVRAVLDKTTA